MDVAVKGTPVKGSLGGLPHVASLFWNSSKVAWSTDTPLGSSSGRVMNSWVRGSRNSSGRGEGLEGHSGAKLTTTYGFAFSRILLIKLGKKTGGVHQHDVD